jgi:peptide/nickel transport system permease protein
MTQELPVGELAQEPEEGGSPSAQPGSRRISGGEGFRLFRQSKLAMLGIFIIVAVVLFCFVGPLLYHTDQVATNLQQADLPPGPGHPLGTTPEGYDVLGRLMVGGQSSIELGLSVAVLSTLIGTAWGAVAGYTGGIVDATAMRIVDAILAIPALVYLLILVNIFRPTLLLLIVIISLLSWLYPARLVRSETLRLREQQYVEAVRVAGGRRRRIITRHIVPNSLSVIAVSATFQVADSILLLALLSFLGLGLPPPAATWGGMLSEGLQYIYQGYWWLVYPAAFCIVITTVAFNFMGDALRDSLDVRLHQL